MARAFIVGWAFWICLVAVLAVVQGQSICQEDADCAAPEACAMKSKLPRRELTSSVKTSVPTPAGVWATSAT
ncbi:MAG: hypothetical protein ABGY24_18425 [bacterium]